jgi:hypothetical protein
LQGVKKVLLNIEKKHGLTMFDRILGDDPTIKLGTLKPIKCQNKWYAAIFITQEVPDAKKLSICHPRDTGISCSFSLELRYFRFYR